MALLTDEDVGLSATLTDADVGLTNAVMSDEDVGLSPQTAVKYPPSPRALAARALADNVQPQGLDSEAFHVAPTEPPLSRPGITELLNIPGQALGKKLFTHPEAPLQAVPQQAEVDPDKSLIGISPEMVEAPTRALNPRLGRVARPGGEPATVDAAPAGGVATTAALRALAGLGQFITSPHGVVEMGAAATPLAPAVAAKWMLDMSEGAKESLVRAWDAYQKGDKQGMADNLAAAGLMAAGVGKGVHEAGKALLGKTAPGEAGAAETPSTPVQEPERASSVTPAAAALPIEDLGSAVNDLKATLERQQIAAKPEIRESEALPPEQTSSPSVENVPPEPETIPPETVEPKAATELVKVEPTKSDAREFAVPTDEPLDRPAEDVKPTEETPAEEAKPTEEDPKVVGFLAEQANRARQRLINRQGELRFGAGPLHEIANITDWAIIGAEKLARGTVDFAQWSKEMLTEIGERIKPHLTDVYSTSVDHLKKAVDAFTVPKSDVQRIIERESGFTREPQAKIQVGERTALKTILGASEKAGESGRKAGVAEGRAELRPKIEDLTEKLSDSVSKARALKEYFRGQERAGQAGRSAATGELKEADAWLEADTKRVRDSLHSLIEDSLPVAERGRFMRMVSEATARPPLLKANPERMYQRAAMVAAKVVDHAEQLHRAGLVEDIRDTAKRATESPGVDVAFKNRIRSALANMALKNKSPGKLADLRATQEYIKRVQMEGRGYTMPHQILRELADLGKRSLSDLPTDALQALRDKLDMHEKLGRLKVELRQNRWEAEKAERLGDLRNQPTTRLEDRPELRPQPGEKGSFGLRLRNAINRKLNAGALLDKALSPVDMLFDLMDSGKAKYSGWLMRNLRGPIDLAYNRMLVRKETLIAPVQELWTRYKMNHVNAERIGVYAACQQEFGRARLIEMGADPGTINAILSGMKPEEMEVYRAMRKAMESTLPEVKTLMHELYNVEVKPVKNYFPMPRDWKLFEEKSPVDISDTAKPGDIPFDELATWKGMEADYHPRRTTSVSKGFTEERVKNPKSPIKINAAEVFAQHIQDVAHLLATQRDLKLLGEMTRDEMFSEKYGRQGQRYALDWLDTVARQGGVDSFRRFQWLDRQRVRIGLGTVGFRLASQFVHLANVPLASWHSGGPGWYLKGLASVFTDDGQTFIAKHFAETKARSGGEMGIVEQGKRPELGETPVRTRISEAAFWVARNIDRINSQGVAMGRYFHELAQKGVAVDAYRDIPVDDEALQMALVRTRRAVASPAPKDVPQMLSRGTAMGGNVSLARTIFQFGNIFLDQWSNARYDLASAGIKERNVKQIVGMAATLAAVVLAETGIRAGAKAAINAATGYQPKHDDDFTSLAEHEALKRFPGEGMLMQMLMRGETGIPTIDLMVGAVRGVALAAGAKTESGKERATVKELGTVGQVAGIPGSSQAADIVQKAIAPHKPKAVAEIRDLVKDWKSGQTKPVKEYDILESKLADNNIDGARAEIQRLTASGVKLGEINKHFVESAKLPFTGSERDERAFYRQLTPEQQAKYKEARMQKRELVVRFRQAARPTQ